MFDVGWWWVIKGGYWRCHCPLPLPIKILIVHIQEQIHRRPIYFVGLILGGDVMQGSWVSLSRDDECMDNKIYS